MAATRTTLSKTDFVQHLVVEGVSPDIAEFVWKEASFYYFEPLQPDPGDRWETTLRIDPIDLEEITEKFWKSQAWQLPSHTNPISVPADPSLSEYAAWLEVQRSLHK